MSADISYGWGARPAATGGSFSLTKTVGWLTAGVVVLAAVGTGGELQLEQLQRAALSPSIISSPVAVIEIVRTPSQDLIRIRQILSPAVSDLAITLGVARQSIYNWLNGESVTEENAGKLRDLAQAADVLSHEGIAVNSMLLKRKFANGKTLFQVAQAGESARDAAMVLVQILKRETEQRERMNARFANRGKTPATSDFDLPAPNDNA